MNTDMLLRRLLGTRGVATQWHSTKPLTGIKQETCNCKFPLLGKRIHAVEMFIYSEKLILYATIGSTEMDCKCIEIRLSSSLKTLSTLANPTINCTNSNFNAIAWNLTFLLLFSSFSLPFLFPFFFLFFFSFLFLSLPLVTYYDSTGTAKKPNPALGSYLWHLLINLSTNSHVERVQL